jgi:hypothetical protein
MFDKLGITSDSQLLHLADKMHIPISFIGFAEELTQIPMGFSIINLGDEFQGGSHWTMLYSDNKQIIYYDSYGVGPEDEIIALVDHRPLYINTKQLQRLEEEHCGVWVLLAMDAINKADSSRKKEAFDDWLQSYSAI